MVVLNCEKTPIKEGLQEEFLEIAKEMTARTREEAGCISYDLVRRQNDTQVFYLSKNTRMKGRWNFIGQPSISKP